MDKRIEFRMLDKTYINNTVDILKDKMISRNRASRSITKQKVHISHKTEEKTYKIKSQSCDPSRIEKKY